MDKIRYAVIGAGSIAQHAFMPSVDQTGNSVMTAIVSGNVAKAEKLAAFYGIDHIFGYDQYEAALAAKLFDAVYIALPNAQHAEFGIKALEAGIHALVEKPLAVTVEECEAMIAAADRGKAHLMTAYRLHCEPGTVEALRLIREGAIGTPCIFSSEFAFMAQAPNTRLQAAYWAGPLQDLGVYCINAARHVFGAEPVEAISATVQGDDPRFAEVERTQSVILRFPGEALATFSVGFDAQLLDTYRVVGTEGEIEMRPAFMYDGPIRMTLRQASGVTEKTFPDIDHFGAETAYFSDCILRGERPRPDGEEGLADVRVLLAIEAAAKTRQPQPIDNPARPRHPTPDMVRSVERTERRLIV